MSMIICPGCSRNISEHAASCPYCGRSFTDNKNKVKSVRIDDGILLYKAREYDLVLQNLLRKESYITSKMKFEIISDYCEAYDLALTLSRNIRKRPLFGAKKKLHSFIEQFDSFNKKVNEHNKNYVKTELMRNKNYFDTILKSLDPSIHLDDEQRTAIVTDDDICLLIAGAGSGKTTTLAAKIKYLVEKKGIDPSEILVFSFMRKAVGELKERVNTTLGIPAEIRTFHSFGYSIIRTDFDTPPQLCRSSFGILNDIIKDKVRADNDLLWKLLFFMGYYFDLPEGVFRFDSLDQFHLMKRSRNYESMKSDVKEYVSALQMLNTRSKKTLDGEFLRSMEEVHIANYLYLNGFEYEYERTYPHPIPGSKKKYTPDFFIKQDGIEVYLEHFGLDESGNNDRYSPEELEKYRKRIIDKREHHKKHGTIMLETYSSYNDGRPLIEHLKEVLVGAGFTHKPLDPNVVYQKILDNSMDKYVWRFVDFTEKFIELFKVAGNDDGGFDVLRSKTDNLRALLFLDIAEEVYRKYQQILHSRNEVDFADMINDAERQLIEMRENSTKLPYKYIIVDEFQDVARQRFELIKRLSEVTDAKIIAVGDDWQSIYAFAGSNVTLFTKFTELMGCGTELKITHTYRNSQELIDIAGGFIQRNPGQISKKLISKKSLKDPIKVLSVDGRQGGFMKALSKSMTDTIGNIIGEFGEDSSILILSRYGFDKKKLIDTGDFRECGNSKIECLKYPKANIDFLTVHKSKGLGYDNVIIMNMGEGKYGFPCQIEDDPIMRLVAQYGDNIEFAEERRLFYVALTRTKKRIYILAPNNNPSRFLIELFNNYGVSKPEKMNSEVAVIKKNRCHYCGYPLKYENNKTYGLNLYVCTNDPEVCGCMSNKTTYPYDIRKCPECDEGYLVVREKDGDVFYGCTSYKPNSPGCGKTIPILRNGRFVLKDYDE